MITESRFHLILAWRRPGAKLVKKVDLKCQLWLSPTVRSCSLILPSPELSARCPPDEMVLTRWARRASASHQRLRSKMDMLKLSLSALKSGNLIANWHHGNNRGRSQAQIHVMFGLISSGIPPLAFSALRLLRAFGCFFRIRS